MPPLQVAVMACIVATLLLLPVGALLALVCELAFGVSPHSFVTFDDTFNEPVGVLAWWAAALLPAGVYALIMRR